MQSPGDDQTRTEPVSECLVHGRTIACSNASCCEEVSCIAIRAVRERSAAMVHGTYFRVAHNATAASNGAMTRRTVRRQFLGWAVIAAVFAGAPAARADPRSCCAPTPGAPGSEEKGWTMTSEELAKLGEVKFPISCAAAVQRPFAQGVAMLHSFWFDEATRVFSRIAATDPSCAMAYWGIAMSLYHPLWTP